MVFLHARPKIPGGQAPALHSSSGVCAARLLQVLELKTDSSVADVNSLKSEVIVCLLRARRIPPYN